MTWELVPDDISAEHFPAAKRHTQNSNADSCDDYKTMDLPAPTR